MKKNGFTIFEIVVVLAVVAIIAAAGYGVYKRGHHTTVSNAIPSTTATNVSSAPPVSKSSDLTNAEQVLNQNDPSSTNTSDSSQLNSQLSGF